LSVIPVLRKPRQEDSKFKVSLGYIVRPCLKNKNKNKPSFPDSWSLKINNYFLKNSNFGLVEWLKWWRTCLASVRP
jgi:hypothetical protein